MNTLPKQNDKDVHTQFFSSTKTPWLACHNICSAPVLLLCINIIFSPTGLLCKVFWEVPFLNKCSNGWWDSVFLMYGRFKCSWVASIFYFFLALYQEKRQESWDLLSRRWDFFAIYWCNSIKRMFGPSRVVLIKIKNVYAKFGTFQRTCDL